MNRMIGRWQKREGRRGRRGARRLPVRWLGLVTLAASLTMPLAHEEVTAKLQALAARIAEEPENADLYFERAEILRGHRDWGEALADYRRVRELDPERVEIDYSIGLLLQQAGYFQRALGPLAATLERDPGHAGALAARGRAREGLGRHLAAAEDLTAAIDHHPPDRRPAVELYLDRARALEAAGEEHRVRALRGIEAGLTRLGSQMALEEEALRIEEDLGRTDAALSRLERLAGAAEYPQRLEMRQAGLLAGAGRVEEARAKYRAILASMDGMSNEERLRSGSALMVRPILEALAALPSP